MATHSSILAWRIAWTEEDWRATVHVGAKNRTPLKQLSMHAYTHEHLLCTYYVQSRYTRHHGGSGVGKKKTRHSLPSPLHLTPQ